MNVLIPRVQSLCCYCASQNLLAAISFNFPTWKIKEYVKPQELLFFESPDIIFVHSDHLKSSEDMVNQLQRRNPEIKWVGWFCLDGNDGDNGVSILSWLLNEFLFCPFSNEELEWRLKRLERKYPLAEFSSCLEMEDPIEPLEKIETLIGEAPALRVIVNQIPLLAKSSYPVLIQGETGTGKELLARAIHYNGHRKDQPFLPINCSAIPETLFENELFGHEKGAYTGALGTHKGMLEEAGSGTIFLDEVDSLSLSSQAKLLRVLQAKEIRPLGSSKTLKCEARILSATNADLSSLIKAKSFREDLFYRLNILPVHLPPLRERIEDIPALVQKFLNTWEGGIQKKKSESLPAALRNYRPTIGREMYGNWKL